jgi:hypothetical protein
MVTILLAELTGPMKSRVKHAVGISMLALSAPLAWMARNIVYFGNPFYVAGSGVKRRAIDQLGHSFFEYLNSQPVLEHFTLNFYGLLGWCGTGGGDLYWFQVHSLPLTVFSILIFSLGSISIIYVVLHHSPWGFSLS